MADTNSYTRAAERLADRLSQAEKDSEKAKALPFGMERVTPEAEAKAFAFMNREGRAKFMEQHATEKDPKGVAYTMKVIQRIGKQGKSNGST